MNIKKLEKMEDLDFDIIERLFKTKTQEEIEKIMQDTSILLINESKSYNIIKQKGVNIVVRKKDKKYFIDITLEPYTTLKKPFHLCVGTSKESLYQDLVFNIHLKEGSEFRMLSHCYFPNGKSKEDIFHRMVSNIMMERKSIYKYVESHYYGNKGGIIDIKLNIKQKPESIFKEIFTIKKGSIGKLNINTKAKLDEFAFNKLDFRFYGKNNDYVYVKEDVELNGYKSKSYLISKLALKDKSYAEVISNLTSNAKDAFGHIECIEMVAEKAKAKTIPRLTINNPNSNITHEAALGKVSQDELNTLMARGLTEKEAIDFIMEAVLE